MQTDINKYFLAFLIFTLTFGVLLYDLIGFQYIDEFCALCLFVLYIYYVVSSKNWEFNKAFLVTLLIFLFYLCYSLFIRSNRPIGIFTDLFIQIKPYLAFFCVYSMKPILNENQKKILKSVTLIFWCFLLLVGVGDLFFSGLMNAVIKHPAYYAAAVTATAFTFLFCTRFTTIDKISFLLLLSIGILSGRSKFFGFYVFTLFITLFYSNIKQFKWSFRNIVLAGSMIGLIVWVAQDKIMLYFYEAVTNEVEKDMMARYVLYTTAPQILKDYFPFGSGLGSFATYSSGQYYSDLYANYGVEHTWGMTKSYYSYIADTYYPSLAQFGIAGIILYISFWVYIYRNALKYSKITQNSHFFIMTVLIIGYFGIEGIADSTFTTHRGFYILVVLGLVLANIRDNADSIEKIKTS